MCFVPGWLALGAPYSDQRRDEENVGFFPLKNWKLWNIYGKTMAKSMEKMEKSGRDGKSTEHMENLWKTGDRNHGPPQILWFMITCPMNNCHFTVIPCYTVVPHSQMQPYGIFLQSKYDTLGYVPTHIVPESETEI